MNRLERRLLHHALQVLMVCAGAAGASSLVGCDEHLRDYEVVDSTQRDYNGGVLFHKQDPKTEAQVNLSPTFDGYPVKWSVPKNQPYAFIPNPDKSTELIILRPTGGTYTEVTVEGEYKVNDTTFTTSRRIHISAM